MATIKDVAERANVSKSLVSRYINHKTGVGPEARERIEKAIQELYYRPNGLARSLIKRRTHCIGVVVDDLSSTFIVPLIEGFERGAQDYDDAEEYTVLYTNSCGDIQKKRNQLDFFTQGHVDGVVIYGGFIPADDVVRRIAASGFPLVLVENDLPDLDVNKVVIDNVSGAFTATEHLIQQGHRRIAHIGGDMNLKVTLERMNGYVNALQAYGIPVDPLMMVFPDFSNKSAWRKEGGDKRLFYECGYEEMKKMLARDHLPQAIFFSTDLAAYGAIKALKEAGLRVPEDISIIGFDDESAAAPAFDATPITTMRQPLKKAGYEGTKLLINSLEKLDAPVERKVLKTELISRETTRTRS